MALVFSNANALRQTSYRVSLVQLFDTQLFEKVAVLKSAAWNWALKKKTITNYYPSKWN